MHVEPRKHFLKFIENLEEILVTGSNYCPEPIVDIVIINTQVIIVDWWRVSLFVSLRIDICEAASPFNGR